MTTSSPDLYALIIRLAAAQSGLLRATIGHLAHAAFLDILRQADPDLAQSLHDWPGRKPFTLSPLGGFGHGRAGQLPVEAGQEGWLRVTLLDPLLFQTFIRSFIQDRRRATIRLGPLDFHVSEILSTPGSHPLAGYTTLDHLYTCWETAEPAPTHQTINLLFSSPTAFSIKNTPHRHMIVLPDPVLIFGQLATYWDDLAGSQTSEAVRLYAAETVVVARHKIETHMAEFRKSKQIGFTGRVQFKLLDRENPTLLRHLNRLADLAFYTGVGSKTTMGMGQVYRIMKDELGRMKWEG
ncbi:MAG: CRISPR-associated endoribonuclease Cas6 [Chloroflexi bacterium]|nr:CRISPR-associated endoribonuclease Cas6 [Chloroflexota bacterium]MCI0581073.1 CRISPR-associated endoribonuclease Cas6 [Chloroflexota bacterium]MCI0649463.1 CRISPR-associated endoribonuclease Cas6 [Chloroflexota bacterium]MCI0731866.1 CRISPR-associated endoribonuclease Cas6 [Chloroflexota bacterium]